MLNSPSEMIIILIGSDIQEKHPRQNSLMTLESVYKHSEQSSDDEFRIVVFYFSLVFLMIILNFVKKMVSISSLNDGSWFMT